MSVNYAPSKLRVPAGFQNLLEGLAREVLREQPENIIQFADKYFKLKLKQRAAGSDGTPVEEEVVTETATEHFSGTPPPDATPVEEAVTKTVTEDLSGTPPPEVVAESEPDPVTAASDAANEGDDATTFSKEQEEAAVKIQSVIRGAHARKEVEALRVASQTAVDEPPVESAVTTDVAEEPPASEEAAAEVSEPSADPEASEPTAVALETEPAPPTEEVDIDLGDPAVLASATKIQAVFRGHQARKATSSEQAVLVEEDAAEAAAEPETTESADVAVPAEANAEPEVTTEPEVPAEPEPAVENTAEPEAPAEG